MAKETKFNSSIKYVGVFDFKEFYNFCFKWLKGEMDLKVIEDEYEEKVKGSEKELKIKWTCGAKVSDYFHYEVKVEFEIKRLAEVEINQGGKKVSTNQGELKLKVKGIIVKDPSGQFQTSAATKMWRGLYETFIIPSRVKEYEDTLANNCDEFLSQAKAFLDLEGRK